jgi:DNA-binding protein H-NS
MSRHEIEIMRDSSRASGAMHPAMQIKLDEMETDDLWLLHIQVSELLKQRIRQEKLRLEERLRLLRNPASARRPNRAVSPKYRNPDQSFETWAGRGKRPRWLVAQLALGKRIDDFRIKKTADRR